MQTLLTFDLMLALETLGPAVQCGKIAVSLRIHGFSVVRLFHLLVVCERVALLSVDKATLKRPSEISGVHKLTLSVSILYSGTD